MKQCPGQINIFDILNPVSDQLEGQMNIFDFLYEEIAKEEVAEEEVCENLHPTFGCAARDAAKELMLLEIIEGSDNTLEMCKEQCCKGCTKSCGYRCGRC